MKKHVEMKDWGKQISASPCHPCLKCNTKHFWNVLPSASPYSISSISPSFLGKQNNSDTDGLQVSTLTTKYCFFQKLKMVALALAPHAKCQKHSSLPPATISSHSLSWVLFQASWSTYTFFWKTLIWPIINRLSYRSLRTSKGDTTEQHRIDRSQTQLVWPFC